VAENCPTLCRLLLWRAYALIYWSLPLGAVGDAGERHASSINIGALFEHVSQFHFKMSSRMYSVPRTFLYSFRATLALF
jgi:hypothetical protein